MTSLKRFLRPPMMALLATAVLIALLGAGIGLARQRAHETVPPPSAAQIAKIRTVALNVAAANGDATPTGLTLVPTTRKAINALNGGSVVNTDEDVYAVTLHGDFTAYGASSPGDTLPSGHLMILVFDAETLEIGDFILGDYPIDATQLGKAIPLEI
jgi:hypothetical protein